jgi:hypothetical protein
LHRIHLVGLCCSGAEATLAGSDKRQSRGTDKAAPMKLEGFEYFEWTHWFTSDRAGCSSRFSAGHTSSQYFRLQRIGRLS